MTWEPPAFEEIKMDAELTAYCDDIELVIAAEPPAPPAACDSAS